MSLRSRTYVCTDAVIMYKTVCTVCEVHLFHADLLQQSAPRFSRKPKYSLELTVVRLVDMPKVWF
jgi:hypothetical protein